MCLYMHMYNHVTAVKQHCMLLQNEYVVCMYMYMHTGARYTTVELVFLRNFVLVLVYAYSWTQPIFQISNL